MVVSQLFYVKNGIFTSLDNMVLNDKKLMSVWIITSLEVQITKINDFVQPKVNVQSETGLFLIVIVVLMV